MSDEGTTLEELETGAIRNPADSEKIAAIMHDINASGGGPSAASASPTMHYAPPPMYAAAPPPPQRPAVRYIEEEEEAPVRPRRKRNMWSTISESVRDPLIVSVIVFVLSLPILHTQLAKHAGWAYAVGGQLSWIGLFMVSVIGGVLFGITKAIGALF